MRADVFPINIGFALLSNSHNPVPSTRIACLNIFPHLKRAGFHPAIIFDPSVPSETPDVGKLVESAVSRGCKVVVFQKIHGPSVLKAVRELRRVGVRTIYSVCDLVDNEMAAETDVTIVVTDFLKSLYRAHLQDRIFVVHDGIERPEVFRASLQTPNDSRKALKAALVTSHPLYAAPVLGVPPSGWKIDIIGRFPDCSSRLRRAWAARWALASSGSLVESIAGLYSLIHPRIDHVVWTPRGVYERLLNSDIGVIPIDTSVKGDPDLFVPSWKVKSENRLTLKMAIGLPVIATPIPSYEAVIEHGENGFLARSRKDWLACLQRLRDPEVRQRVGLCARRSILQKFSMDVQADRFITVLLGLIGDQRSVVGERLGSQ